MKPQWQWCFFFTLDPHNGLMAYHSSVPASDIPLHKKIVKKLSPYIAVSYRGQKSQIFASTFCWIRLTRTSTGKKFFSKISFSKPFAAIFVKMAYFDQKIWKLALLPQYCRNICSDYLWPLMIETDMPVYVLTCFRVHGDIQDKKLVKNMPKI